MSFTEAKDLPEFDKLWDFNRPAESEAKFRAFIPEAKKSNDKEYYLQLLTQIARTQGLQRKFEEAHRTLDDVQNALSSSTKIAEVRYFLERGRVLNSSKKDKESLPQFIKAYDLAISHKLDNLAVDSAHMIAIAESPAEKQIQWNLTAMSIAEKSKDQKARDWLGSLYNNLGWTYHESGKFEEALKMFQNALDFRVSKGDASTIRIAKWSVARTYRSMKKFEDAILIQSALEKELELANEKDGYVFEELGELYLLASRKELSQKYFKLAYKVLSKNQWIVANESKRLERIRELSGLK